MVKRVLYFIHAQALTSKILLAMTSLADSLRLLPRNMQIDGGSYSRVTYTLVLCSRWVRSDCSVCNGHIRAYARCDINYLIRARNPLSAALLGYYGGQVPQLEEMIVTRCEPGTFR